MPHHPHPHHMPPPPPYHHVGPRYSRPMTKQEMILFAVIGGGIVLAIIIAVIADAVKKTPANVVNQPEQQMPY